MARKKSFFQQQVIKAAARDRKRDAQKRMRVSGKSVFNLARLVGGTSSQSTTRASKKAK